MRTLKLAAVLWGLLFFGSPQSVAAQGNCYAEINDFCIPGMINNETWQTLPPQHTIGKALPYGPGIMEATAASGGMSLSGFYCGVATPSLSMIGEIVWLKRPKGQWEGPCLVVDVSQRNHQYYHIIGIESVVEVDFKTSVRWGLFSADNILLQGALRDVEMFHGLLPPVPKTSSPIPYKEAYLEYVAFTLDYESPARNNSPQFTSYQEYRDVVLGNVSDPVTVDDDGNIMRIQAPPPDEEATIMNEFQSVLLLVYAVLYIPLIVLVANASGAFKGQTWALTVISMALSYDAVDGQMIQAVAIFVLAMLAVRIYLRIKLPKITFN